MAGSFDATEITETLVKHCTRPLALALDEGCLVAADWMEGGAYDIAISFGHPEGPLSFGFDIPTNAEHYEIDPGELGEDYAANRCTILHACGNDIADDPPWDEVDEQGTELSTPDLQANLVFWLFKPIDAEIAGLGDALSEFAPGIAIHEALSEDERDRFGMRKVSRGGHASSVPAVTFTADAAEFNLFLQNRGLPYRLGVDPN